MHRKYEGKISTLNAFCILLYQKAMSMIVGRLLLYNELPTFRDPTYLILFSLHLTTFLLFRTTQGKRLMNTLEKSQVRKVAQETFKGYGKALTLITLVGKGLQLHSDTHYFLAVLTVRGSVSAMFKATYLSLLLKTPINLKQAKQNFLLTTLPSVLLYLALKSVSHRLEHAIIQMFLVFMATSRFYRAVNKSTQKKLCREMKSVEKEEENIEKGMEEELMLESEQFVE